MKKIFIILTMFMLVVSLVSCNNNSDSSSPIEIKINFNSNGGDEVDSIKTMSDLLVTLPLIGKSGYYFKGWYLDD